MDRVTGRITATCLSTSAVAIRSVRSFLVSSDMPYVNIVDEAIDRTFPDGNWDVYEDELDLWDVEVEGLV